MRPLGWRQVHTRPAGDRRRSALSLRRSQRRSDSQRNDRIVRFECNPATLVPAPSIVAWVKSLVPDLTVALKTVGAFAAFVDASRSIAARSFAATEDKKQFDLAGVDRTLFYLVSNEPRPSFLYRWAAFRMRFDASCARASRSCLSHDRRCHVNRAEMAFISSRTATQFADLARSLSVSKTPTIGASTSSSSCRHV